MSRTVTHPDDLGVFGLPGDVSPWDIRFDPGDAKHLERVTDGRLRFTVWTEPDLIEAWLVVRSLDGWILAHEMEAWSATGRFTHWSTEVALAGPVEYSFALRARTGEPVYRVRDGVSASVERLDRWLVDPADLTEVVTPTWAHGAVVYQIFPDRFANGDPASDPDGTVPWGTAPHPREFQGGDLVGIEQRLAYLSELGVTALYLNPIFLSPSNHRYDTTDYRQVDPALGGDEALRRLVAAAHERQIRVILDASFNHVHPSFFAFRDLIEHGRSSDYRDWFVVREWPVRIRYRPEGRDTWPDSEWIDSWRRETGMEVEVVSGVGRTVEPTYDSWYGVPTMPRVDLAHEPARRYMLEVASHWVREFGIDGWRMDVARYVDPDFWNDFRAIVKSADPDAFLIAEVMGDAGAWLQGDRFDATMNYTFRSIALRFFARDEIGGVELLDEAARLLAQYAWQVSLVNHNLIGSHDTPRFRTEAGGEEWRLRLATVFQLTFPGAAGIYYGDEVGLQGGGDPACRGAFPWEPDPMQHPLVRTVRELTELRVRRSSLRRGRWAPRYASGDAVVFDRIEGDEVTTVAINRGSERVEMPVSSGVAIRWGHGEANEGRVEVPGRSAAILW